MKIKVLFFGLCRESINRSEHYLELTPHATVSTAFAALTNEFPSLSHFGNSLLFAVNEEHCAGSQKLADGDVLAIFPPVSGG